MLSQRPANRADRRTAGTRDPASSPHSLPAAAAGGQSPAENPRGKHENPPPFHTPAPSTHHGAPRRVFEPHLLRHLLPPGERLRGDVLAHGHVLLRGAHVLACGRLRCCVCSSEHLKRVTTHRGAAGKGSSILAVGATRRAARRPIIQQSYVMITYFPHRTSRRRRRWPGAPEAQPGNGRGREDSAPRADRERRSVRCCAHFPRAQSHGAASPKGFSCRRRPPLPQSTIAARQWPKRPHKRQSGVNHMNHFSHSPRSPRASPQRPA